jgi:hypothetical protein
MKLIIELAKWARGERCYVVPDEPYGHMYLLNDDESMCCLGFFGRACGIPSESLLHKLDPLEAPSRKWPEWLVSTDTEGPNNTTDCIWLMEANDTHLLTDEQRMTRVAELFAKHGVEVEFK